MTTLFLLAALTRAELVQMHRANVQNWTRHTPAEERVWRETERTPKRGKK